MRSAIADSLRKGATIRSPSSRMLLDVLEFLGGQRPRLVQDRLAGADLADVVQLGAKPDVLQQLADVAELNRGLHRVPADPGGVAAGVGVLRLQRVHQGLHPVDQRFLVAAVQLPDAGLEILLIESVLQHQLALFQRLVHPSAHLFHHHRLGDVVEGAELEALDGRSHVGHAGQHDDRHVGKEPERLAEEGDPVHLRHVDVGDAERDLTFAAQERPAPRRRRPLRWWTARGPRSLGPWHAAPRRHRPRPDNGRLTPADPD